MATQVGKMKATSINGVKMYSISGQQSLAAWLPPKKLKSFRKNKDYRQRVDLIQDLWFAAATTKIKATPDGQFIIASGTYPPQVKVYELKELSLKFERHLVSEILDFQVLDDDYSKLAFLCADRSVCLHARYGSHYSLRIPRMGRDITYDRWSCDLLCAASSPDIYRINLEQGRFLSSLNTQSQAINIVCRSPVHGLIACGGDDGAVECFDPRMKSAAGRIDAVAPSGDVDQEITALRFDEVGGFHMAVGSSAGKVLVYDLRSSSPIQIKDHMYGSPIVDIKWHQTLNSSRAKLISADNHIIRIWDPETGDGMTSIEPSGGTINDVCIFKQSGLMLLALDSSQIPSYFLPALGPAPKWCSHLENQTEEMEESAQTTIYDDFKFLTKEDLERLNLTNLIGTNLLRAELHGYFIDYRLYKKAQALADPFAYDAYRQKKLEEKMEAERASRITIRRKLPKVNRTLAARLLENEEAEEAGVEIAEDTTAKKASKKKKGLSSELLKDTRFAALFENKEFEVDEFSREYLSLHPNSSTKKKPSLIEEHFEPVLDGDERNSDSDVSAPPHSSEDELDEEGSRKAQKWNTARFPRLYEVKDERHAEAFWNSVSLANEDDLPLGERAAALQAKQNLGDANGVKKGPGGSREVSFMSKSSTKFNKDEDDEPDERSRRGTRSLGLKPDRPHFGGRGRSRGRGRGRGPRGGGRGNSRGRGRR